MTLTTGVAAIDDLLDQVRVGDNLVFVASGAADGAWLVDAFIAAARDDDLVIIDSNGRHAAQQAAVVLDWTPSDVIDAATARAQLAEVDAAVGPGASYVIDSLAPLSATWGGQASLDLFLWACPRLFQRQSVALWLVEREAHDDAFLRRLTEITQVVVNISPVEDGAVRLAVVKADGRPATVVGRTVQLGIESGEVGQVGQVVVEQRRFGQMLRDLRESHGVGQAELARRIGISPSALSQAERGVRSVSADTLMRIYDTLGLVSPDSAARGYSVSRRSTQTAAVLGSGVTGRKLVDDDVTAWQLTVGARAAGRQSMFAIKTSEVVIVLEGVFEVEVGGQAETLHAGDALQATNAAISQWRNPADTAAELLWIIGH
jgi:transcriptional regulator with XRE-family HTH domain